MKVDFWQAMYEAAVDQRRESRAMAMWYKRQAREAEMKRRRWQSAVVGVGLAVCCAACVASWAMMIVG